MYLLDTNTCIYLIKNSYPVLTAKLLSLNPTDVAISSITVFELEYGAARSKWGASTRQNLAVFLTPFSILSYDAKDAAVAGPIRAYLERQGSPVRSYDVRIAAQGLAQNLIVVTHNTREFGRIPNLRLEDWVG